MRTSLESSCGQSLVEFAIVLPLLVVLVFGVIETGYVP
jgi:Flp pilus assembly protein TadG